MNAVMFSIEGRRTMVKAILHALLMMLATPVFALTETVDGITWTYVVSNDGCAAIGTGATSGRAVSTSVSGNIAVPPLLGGYRVARISDCAFYECSRLTSVTIPDSVTSIGSAAFYNCSSLTSVTIPDSVTSIGSSAFYGCGWLTSVMIPDGVTSIGYNAFYNCSGLTSVAIPDSVTSIGEWAFYNCRGLTNVTIGNGVTSIGDNAFLGCRGLTSVTIPDSVTSIGSEAFSYCSGLTSVTVGNSVTSIGSYAFSGCSGLKDISVSQFVCTNTVMSIFPSAYQSITNIVIQNGVASIGRGTFNRCSSLEHIMIPSSVVTIGESAFLGCEGLVSVSIPDGVSVIGDDTFYGCSALSSVTIPGSVLRIGEAFSGCDSLFDNTTMPGLLLVDGWVVGTARQFSGDLDLSNVRGIAGGAFKGINDLTRVVLPQCYSTMAAMFPDANQSMTTVVLSDGVEKVPNHMFDSCMSLEEIVFPESIREIGDGAFHGCVNLVRVTMPTVPSILGDLDLRKIDIEGSIETNGFRVYKGWVISYEDATVSQLIIPDGIIGIAPYALSDFWDLEEVTLPMSLEYIGQGAFYGDSYLDSMVIPDGVNYIDSEAFKNCTYLRNITIGDGLRSIGREAFGNCSQLTAISMPDTVTSIGDSVCSNCWRMTSVKFPLGLDSIGKGMFTNCTSLVSATVPTSNFTMKELFGERYNRLTSVSIITGETRVCASAFEGCSFRSIEIPEGITNCGDRAFYNSGVYDVVFPDSVSTIGREIFRNCGVLHNVTLSRSLAVIPDYAFYTSSTALRSIVVPPSVRYIGGNVCYNESGRLGCNALYFLGNAPEYDIDAYKSGPDTRTYVVQGSRGWDGIPSSRDLPETWIGRPISFWTPTRFNATFNANGGKFSGGANTVQCEEMTDTAFIIPTSDPTRIGYAFAGWWTAPDGGTQIKTTTRVSQTSEMTIYAHWTRVEEIVEVRFEPNDGTGSMPNQTFTYGEALALSPNQFVRAGYVFLGWSRTANGDVAYTDGEVIQNLTALGSGTVTLFAVWAIDSSNVTFAVDGDKAWGVARFARNGEAVWQSGAIGDNQNSVMEAHVRGSGAITFDWQASCEDSFRGMRLDYLAFHVDGVEKSFVNGSTEWATESFVIEGAGDHVLRWVYVKDSEGSNYDDCGRVSSVTWSPSLNSLGDFLNAPSVGFSTAGDALWSGQTTVSHDGVASLRSGAISDGGMTRLECAVSGPGTVSFWWKASCEAPFRGVPLDFVEFSVDGVQKEWIAGETDWTNAIVSVESAGRHVLAWTYQKDDWEGTSDGEDCAWVDEVSWTPAADADVTVDVGGGKFVIVPGTWLSEKTNKAATDAAANGRKVWECYVLGLDPEDGTNDFKIVSFPMKSDGTPDLDAITISPPKSQWNVNGATPVLKGKATMEDEGAWQPVTDENKAGMRFFRVEVELP